MALLFLRSAERWGPSQFLQAIAWFKVVNNNYYIGFGPDSELGKYLPPLTEYVTFKFLPLGW